MESAIKERREAEKKYEDLLEKIRPLSQIKQGSNILGPSNSCGKSTSLQDLASSSDSGDETGKDERKEKHVQKQLQEGRSKDANLSGISKKTRRI